MTLKTKVNAALQANISTKKKKKKKIFTASNVMLYLMFLPAIIHYVIFSYIPMPGILLAFADYRIGGFNGWVGLENFRYLFNLPYFWQAFLNTWIFVILRYLISFPAPIIFAILLNEVKTTYYKKFLQTISTLPHFISWVVVAGIWTSMLSPTTGYINYIIRLCGGEPVYFLAKPKLFPFLLTLIGVWKEVGYSAIVYLAAISGIDPELYEAAIVDGATKFHQMRYITLPGIKNTVLVVLVLSFAGVLNFFEPPFVFMNPMIQSTAEVLDVYIYNVGLVKARYSLATAAGLFKSVISFVLLLFANFMSKRLTEDGRGII